MIVLRLNFLVQRDDRYSIRDYDPVSRTLDESTYWKLVVLDREKSR